MAIYKNEQIIIDVISSQEARDAASAMLLLLRNSLISEDPFGKGERYLAAEVLLLIEALLPDHFEPLAKDSIPQ